MCWHLSGMFRRSASLAILQKFRRDTVCLPSAPWAHESQCQIVTRIAAWNCSRLSTFTTDSLLPTRRSEGRKTDLCFARFVFLTFCGPLASHDSNPYPNRSRIALYNATKVDTQHPSFPGRRELVTAEVGPWSRWSLKPLHLNPRHPKTISCCCAV